MLTNENKLILLFYKLQYHISCFISPGGVAAHAFGPGAYTISGNIHLDDDEPWSLSVNPKDGVNLLAVAIHQIGMLYDLCFGVLRLDIA